MNAPDGLERYINALAEASELIRIRKSLQEIDASEYLQQLGRITSGKAFKTAVGADPARDFAFELAVAARFLAAGHAVDLTSVADTVAHVGRYKVFVECKRVQSKSKVLARISEARNQLSKRLASSPSSKSRGLVACKITEVLNPEVQHAVFAHAENFRDASKALLHGYVLEHEVELKQRITKKQLGILFENNLYGVVHDNEDPKSVPAFINCRGATIYQAKLGAEDVALVGTLARGLANQHIV